MRIPTKNLLTLSLVIAYQNIASGMAAIIHFMYPLAVTLGMTLFFKEKKSWTIFTAIALSLVGTALLSSGEMEITDGNMALGLTCGIISVFSYAAYIICVRTTRAAHIDSTSLTCYVMAAGALLFMAGGWIFGDGIRLETGTTAWLYILGLALPSTALSNIALVKAIKLAGPTLTSMLGALEPLTAVLIGVILLDESFTIFSFSGILLIVLSVSLILKKNSSKPISS